MNSLRYSLRRRSRAPEINMAPLMDMIFILLIFFVVTTSFVKEAGVEVDRPVAQTATVKEKTNLVVAVTREGLVYVENRPLDVRLLRAYMERFLAETPDGSVVIAADRQSQAGTVIQVLDACRLAGVKDISLAARIP